MTRRNKKPDLNIGININYLCPNNGVVVELSDKDALDVLIPWAHDGSDDGWYLSDSGINFCTYRCPACGKMHEEKDLK